MAIGWDIFLIYHWGKWVFETQIDLYQEQNWIIKDFKDYILTFDIPPSKYSFINKIKTTYQGFNKERDNILLNLAPKKAVFKEIEHSMTEQSSIVAQKFRIQTDTTLDALNSSRAVVDKIPHKIEIK